MDLQRDQVSIRFPGKALDFHIVCLVGPPMSSISRDFVAWRTSPKDAPNLDQSHAAAQAVGVAEQTSQLRAEGSAPAGPSTRAQAAPGAADAAENHTGGVKW